jgi:MFS family permease
VIALAAFSTLGAFLFLNTLYLQDVRGYSAVRAGVMTIPMAAMLGVFAVISGRVVAAKGPRLPFVFAGCLLTVGALMLVALTRHTSTLYLVVSYAIFGVGAGLVTAPITNTAVSGMPRDQAGVAGAVASSARQFGSALGVAITGSIVAAGSSHRFAGFVGLSHHAWEVVAGCGLLVVVLGLASTGRWARGTAARNGERLGEPTERPETPKVSVRATE